MSRKSRSRIQAMLKTTFMTEPSKIVITSPDGDYDNRLHGWELVSYHWKHFWNKVIDWLINNL